MDKLEVWVFWQAGLETARFPANSHCKWETLLIKFLCVCVKHIRSHSGIELMVCIDKGFWYYQGLTSPSIYCVCLYLHMVQKFYKPEYGYTSPILRLTYESWLVIQSLSRHFYVSSVWINYKKSITFVSISLPFSQSSKKSQHLHF